MVAQIRIWKDGRPVTISEKRHISRLMKAQIKQWQWVRNRNILVVYGNHLPVQTLNAAGYTTDED